MPSGNALLADISAMLAARRESEPGAGDGNVIVGIDGTPAVREHLTGTEVYARSIINALAASRDGRSMRVYANAVDAPRWLPAGVEWRGIPFPRLWTHWRLRQALRRERPEDRKSTRLNSSHPSISYAVFC